MINEYKGKLMVEKETKRRRRGKECKEQKIKDGEKKKERGEGQQSRRRKHVYS